MKKATYLLILLFATIFFGCAEESVTLNATVNFTGTQFVIKNNDNFDYNDAKLMLNTDYVIKGYKLKAGETYTVGIMQFANSDGDRFNTMKKPQTFAISCKVKDNKDGWLYAEWQ